MTQVQRWRATALGTFVAGACWVARLVASDPSSPLLGITPVVEPATDKPATDKRAIESPAAEKPATDQTAPAEDKPPAEVPAAPLDLLAGEPLKLWKAVVPDDAEPAAETWTRPDKTLLCTGKPIGYLRTVERFENFVLEFKWRYPDQEQGNSGVLLCLQDPDKVWPKSIQIQMMNAEAGRIFPLGGATAGDAKPQEQLVVDGRHWQHWQVESRGGLITLRVMKPGGWQVANSLQLKEPLSGAVGFQSEDAKVEFRDVWLTKLPPEVKLPPDQKPPADKPAPSVSAEGAPQP